MMRFLSITDLHGSSDALTRILDRAGPVDFILLGGDLTTFGSPEDAERLVRQAQTAGRVLAIAGNCDSAEIEERLVERGVSLHSRGLVHEGIGVHGLSAIPIWRRGMYQFTEEELAEMLQSGYVQIAGAQQHVVLSHAPPRNSALDRTHFFKHVGSLALREFIERTEPDLVLCGHIHEGRGIERIGQTTVVNCGAAANGYYAVAELGETVAVELCRT